MDENDMNEHEYLDGEGGEDGFDRGDYEGGADHAPLMDGSYDAEAAEANRYREEEGVFPYNGDDEEDGGGDGGGEGHRHERTPEEEEERRKRKEAKKLKREQKKAEKKERREKRRREKDKEKAHLGGTKRRRRSRPPGHGAEDADYVPDNTEAHYSDGEDNLAGGLAGSKRRPRKHVVTEQEAQKQVRMLLERMQKAADEDEIAYAASRPATAKLRLLNEVCTEIVKPKWILWYLSENVCAALARWLSPLPDGSLPNLTVRTQLIQLIHKMPITSEHLRGTGLGTRLAFIWKSPEENEENRNLIRDVVQKIVRPILGLRWSYRSARAHDEDLEAFGEDVGFGTQRDRDRERDETPVEDATPAHDAHDPTRSSRRARIPQQVSYSFKIMPKSSYTGIQGDDGGAGGPRGHLDTASTRLNRMLNSHRGGFAGAKMRAQRVSVSKAAF